MFSKISLFCRVDLEELFLELTELANGEPSSTTLEASVELHAYTASHALSELDCNFGPRSTIGSFSSCFCSRYVGTTVYLGLCRAFCALNYGWTAFGYRKRH